MAEWVKLTLRLPEKLHAAVVRSADDSGKSINQVIVDDLNRINGFPYLSEDEINDHNVLERLSALERDVFILKEALHVTDIGLIDKSSLQLQAEQLRGRFLKTKG